MKIGVRGDSARDRVIGTTRDANSVNGFSITTNLKKKKKIPFAVYYADIVVYYSQILGCGPNEFAFDR